MRAPVATPSARPWLHHAHAHGYGPPQNSSRWTTPWPSWARPLSYPPTPLTVYCLVLKWLFWLYHETARHKTSTTKWAGLTELPLDPVGRGHWDTHLRHWQESRSREILEETKIFLCRIAEANFHVSFSSRFSRNGEKVPLSPLYFQDSRKNSLSPLDFQFQFLCTLSIFKIFSLNILIINNFPLRKPTRSCFGPISTSTRKIRIRRQ